MLAGESRTCWITTRNSPGVNAFEMPYVAYASRAHVSWRRCEICACDFTFSATCTSSTRRSRRRRSTPTWWCWRATSRPAPPGSSGRERGSTASGAVRRGQPRVLRARPAWVGRADALRPPLAQRVRVLENDEVVIDGVRFLGCSLWSDFDSPGPTNARTRCGSASGSSTTTSRSRLGADRRLQPQDTRDVHSPAALG